AVDDWIQMRRRGLVRAVGNRRPFAGFPRACGKRWAGTSLLGFEAVHGFPQPVSVHRPLGAKRRGSCLRLSCGLDIRARVANRRSLEVDAVSVVEQAVADGVGEVGIADDREPVLGPELTGDERGGALGAVLDDLDEVPALIVT